MKLLLDENLSFRLVSRLAGTFPGSQHIGMLGLTRASDNEIWSFAGSNGFMIVSKDSDFVQLALARGHPPKVLMLDVGNCSTDDVVHVLVEALDEIRAFGADDEQSVCVVRRPS